MSSARTVVDRMPIRERPISEVGAADTVDRRHWCAFRMNPSSPGARRQFPAVLSGLSSEGLPRVLQEPWLGG